MSNDDLSAVPEGAAVLPLIPAELGIDPLLLAVLHAVVFFDGSEDDMIDPDAAVESLEYLATYLQRLDGPRLRKVKEDLLVLASYAKEQGWGQDQVRFFEDFLAEFGNEHKKKR
jgi:hypothetical protein